jgi:hypothetical protein
LRAISTMLVLPDSLMSPDVTAATENWNVLQRGGALLRRDDDFLADSSSVGGVRVLRRDGERWQR